MLRNCTEQRILRPDGQYLEVGLWLEEMGTRHLLLVCDSSIQFLRIHAWLEKLQERSGIALTTFSDFQPNPLYESVQKGVRRFREAGCDAIMAVGGGSAMDVAKCIKLYCNMEPDCDYLAQTVVPNAIPFLAMPTTAGTGSEATRYAVIYRDGEKQSITDESAIPQAVLMDASVLETLPPYQKKVTMLDAFCHGIESFWSVHANETSMEYSRQAIESILLHMDGYLHGVPKGHEGMLQAAHIAGKAINITQTTAGHAMCYKLTSLYGIAHGHAAALCVPKLWKYMLSHGDMNSEPNGFLSLKSVFERLAQAMGCRDCNEAAEAFESIVASLGLPKVTPQETDFALLRDSVNPVRLKNNPVRLNRETIEQLYHEILR